MKAICLFLALLALCACSRSPKEKGWEIFDEMVHSQAYEAFSENPNTPDGKTQLPPVLGTIARGQMPYYYGRSDADAERAGRELKSPVSADESVLKRGKEMYGHYCVSCHGQTGEGDGPLIPKFPNPPSFHTKRLKGYPAGRIFHVITVGSGAMAEHGTQILPEDRWAIAYYVMEMKKE
ncbi:MAG: cytochrome c [Bdellovibrionales bacterium]|nr:cytochrome c [Bdellovibrionales bacterium]